MRTHRWRNYNYVTDMDRCEHSESHMKLRIASPLARARAWIILRGCISACVLAIDLGFVTTPRVLHVCAWLLVFFSQCQVLSTNTRKKISNGLIELRRRHRDSQEDNTREKFCTAYCVRVRDHVTRMWWIKLTKQTSLRYNLLKFTEVYDYPKSG